jgi:two-component system chemotaxis response regulator CheY
MSDKVDFRTLRVLIVGGKAHAVRTLRTALSMAGILEIVSITDARSALTQLRVKVFDVIFCDDLAEKVDGMPFPVAARRTPDVLDHMTPLFLISRGPRRSDVEVARDEGVTDVLARPLSAATIIRKLTVALTHPRSFIAAPDFFGPDRRAKARPTFHGSDRRSRKTRKISVSRSSGDPTLI